MARGSFGMKLLLLGHFPFYPLLTCRTDIQSHRRGKIDPTSVGQLLFYPLSIRLAFLKGVNSWLNNKGSISSESNAIGSNYPLSRTPKKWSKLCNTHDSTEISKCLTSMELMRFSPIAPRGVSWELFRGHFCGSTFSQESIAVLQAKIGLPKLELWAVFGWCVEPLF